MADYDGNGLAAFNDARSRGWGGSVTLADLEKLSAGNPIAHGIAAVWPDAPPSRVDQAYQTSIDRWKQLGKDVFFAPANGLKAFMDQPTFNNALGIMPMGGIGKMPPRLPGGVRPYTQEHVNQSLDWMARARYGASDVAVNPSDLASTRKDIVNYFQHNDPTEYVRMAIRQGMADPNIPRINTAPSVYVDLPQSAKSSDFYSTGGTVPKPPANDW